jgi:dihydroxyacetone kinase
MKKLINSPAAIVPEMLEGLVRLNPDLALLEGQTVVVRAGGPAEGVALISGGGAGHEPAHAGYVGSGLLHAAVAGDVFTSPSTDAVLAAIRAVAGPAGVLLIVKNYTGDRLNFGLAAELARAEGIPAEVVIVDDDVALAGGADTAGRRGIAGTVFIHKVAGACAAAGLDLAAVKQAAQAAVAALGSMGVALTACTVPAAGKPGFTLGEEEVELGLGIHGEAGVRRTAMAPADQLVETLLRQIVAQKSFARGSRVALLVNNLGGTPAMELAIVARHTLAVLEAEGIVVERAWAGTFLTAIEMAGCSISLLALDDERLKWLDAAATAPAWVAGQAPGSVRRQGVQVPVEKTSGTSSPIFEAVLRAICAALTQAEPKLTAMDQAVGDGDLGISLARGAAAILAEMPGYDLARPSEALKAMSATLRRALGGTSGPLYAVFLLRAARTLEGAGTADAAAWAEAFAQGAAAIGQLGDARPGDRTMLDAMVPAADALKTALLSGLDLETSLKRSVVAAQEGTEATATMSPRRGRSSYLGDRVAGKPDPGAEAVAIWLAAVTNTVVSTR